MKSGQRRIGGEEAQESLYVHLGTELMRLRLVRGYSLRKLAHMIGMTAHSGLVDYERGRRIPPPDLMNLLYGALQPSNDRLGVLYREALDCRASRRCGTAVASDGLSVATGLGKQVSAREIRAMVELLEAITVRLRNAMQLGAAFTDVDPGLGV